MWAICYFWNISDIYVSHESIFLSTLQTRRQNKTKLLTRFSITYSSATPKRRYFYFATLKHRVFLQHRCVARIFFATPRRRDFLYIPSSNT
jgi:hypothetical protein